MEKSGTNLTLKVGCCNRDQKWSCIYHIDAGWQRFAIYLALRLSIHLEEDTSTEQQVHSNFRL